MRRRPKIADLGIYSRAANIMFANHQVVWIFQCSKRLAFHAATLDEKGANLPAKMCAEGLWVRSGQLFLGSDNQKSVGIDIDALKVGIAKEGFYLWNADLARLIHRIAATP